MNPKVLVLNEVTTHATQYELVLGRAGLKCVAVREAGKLAEAIEQHRPDVVLCDLLHPEINGIAILDRIAGLSPDLPVIILTDHPTVENAVESMKHHAADYLGKPFQVEELLKKLQELSRGRATRSAPSQNGGVPEAVRRKIIGASPALNSLLEVVLKVARTDINVMITGESGTGKEVIARAIHQLSNRSDEAFVPVDCASFPENLLESELFGYKKGAFTGAHKDHKGLLEFANKGTLFLDEIGEMPILLQAKLLRVIQERQFRPIGGLEQKAMDVRVLAATNRNLEDMVHEKTFRQDLYFRLNVMTLSLPPLRERREDIGLLANYFLRIFTKDNRLGNRELSKRALAALRQYDWPGNVRELQNVVESAATICAGEVIEVEDLPEAFRGGSVELHLDHLKHRSESVEQFQREYLINLLIEHQFNISKAAEQAGCHRRTLHRMIHRYEVDVSRLREQHGG